MLNSALGTSRSAGGSFNGGTVPGTSTFTGEVDLNGLVTIKVQTFANGAGAIGTIDPTAGTAIEVTGSNASASGTLNLNSSPVTGTEIWVTNKSTAQVIIGGNGATIAGSNKIEATNAALFHYNGTEWTVQDTGITLNLFDFISTLGSSPLMFLTAAAAGWATANTAVYQQIKVSRRVTPIKLVWLCTTQSGNYDVAILDSAGTRIWSKGTTACPAAGAVTETVSGVIFDNNKTYYIGFAADNTTLALRTFATLNTITVQDSQGNSLCTSVATNFPIPSSVTYGSTGTTRVPAIFLKEV